MGAEAGESDRILSGDKEAIAEEGDGEDGIKGGMFLQMSVKSYLVLSYALLLLSFTPRQRGRGERSILMY